MGRKDGQRTKGNTQAASSARSAQQLGEHAGFVGFGTSTEAAFVPLLQAAEAEDGLPGDFRLVLRKMHKKDVTTKVKALQEFLELAEASGEAEAAMAAVLPYWPTVYSKLATDTDRRVRELAHLALAAVVRPVGRQLAPHLRAMVGAWYLGMADPHLQAAAAATAAWELAFPAAKQAGAVAFCQAEILGAVVDNLTVATANTLSDPKTTPVEEMEAKHVRTLAMSLATLTRLLATATPPLDPILLDPLLDHQKLWKLGKHKAGTVRQAFFEALVQVGASHAGSLAARGKVVVAAVLPSLQEAELSAAKAVWAAALQVLAVVPGAWELTSPHKAVFPAVFKFIGSSEGMAAAVFPSLLPFLSRVTEGVMGEQAKFLARWFGALGEAVAGARGGGELRAVVQAYLECLMFVLNQEWLDKGLQEELLSLHVLPLLLRSAREPRLANCGLPEQLGPFLAAWARAGHRPRLAGLAATFWAAITEEVMTGVAEEEGKVEEVLLVLGRLRGKSLELPELDRLVVGLWKELMERLGGGGAVASPCSRLSLTLQLATPEVRAELLPGGEGELVERLLPLLHHPHHRTAICSLLWSVGRALPTIPLADLLARVIREEPAAAEHLLAAAGREARASAGVAAWLAGEAMAELALGLVGEAAEGGEAALATLAALKTAGFRVREEEGMFGTILATLAALLPDQVARVCGLVEVLEVGQLWRREEATPLLLSLFTLDTGVEVGLRQRLEAAWLRGVGGELEVKVGEMVRREVGEEEGEERRLAKCVLVLDHLEEETRDTFLLSTVVGREERGELSGVGALVLTQRRHLSSPPPSSALAAPGLARPRAALHLAHLLLHRLALSATAPPDAVTVADGERSGLAESYTEHLAEVVVCAAYLSTLALTHPEPVPSLAGRLEAAASVLVSHLDRETSRRLVGRVRGASLGEGGVWAAGLAWLVGLQYRTSEWEVGLAGLLPRVDVWTDGELDTAAELLTLATDLGIGGQMVAQTLTVEAARVVSLGGLASPLAAGPAWLVARCLTLTPAGERAGVVEEVAALLATLPSWRAVQEDALLYSRALGGVSWAEARAVATAATLLATAVTYCPAALSPALWDLASCSLVSWAASLEETGEVLVQEAAAAMVAVAVARLGAALGATLGPRGHHPALGPAPAAPKGEDSLPPRLREEWEEFFSEGVFSSLLRTMVALAGAQGSGETRLLLQVG